MTVTTSKGKTFTINWMWGPVGDDSALVMVYKDNRPIAEIASDFDGIEHFHRQSDTEGDMDWDGYSRLDAVIYDREKGTVQLTFTKPYERKER